MHVSCYNVSAKLENIGSDFARERSYYVMMWRCHMKKLQELCGAVFAPFVSGVVGGGFGEPGKGNGDQK